MEINQQRDNDIEIDLREVLSIFIRKLWLIAIVGVLFAFVTILVTKMFITPTYKSTTKMYVLAKENSGTVTSGDLQTSTLLTQDYVELIKSRTVTESVISQLKLKLTHEELLEKMEVTVQGETRIIYVSVIDEDPKLARNIANAIRESAAVHIKKVMNTEAVNVVEEANMPKEKYGPRTIRNGLFAGIIGMFITGLIIFMRYISNDTITTAEDVEKYMELGVLGTIPMNKNEKKQKRKKIRNYRK